MATTESKTEVPAHPNSEPPVRGSVTFRALPEGSPIRLSPEERARRAHSARQTLAEMRAIVNGPEEDDRDLFRALDESHPGRFDLGRFYADGPDPA